MTSSRSQLAADVETKDVPTSDLETKDVAPPRPRKPTHIEVVVANPFEFEGVQYAPGDPDVIVTLPRDAAMGYITAGYARLAPKG